ncbi:MAG: DivIVA domain-containing protein [Actinomycetes bacterium]
MSRRRRDGQETPEQTLARLQRSTETHQNAASGGTPRYKPPLDLVRFKEGYDTAAVDAFLDSVEHRSQAEIHDVLFPTVRFRAGYDEDQVDALLEDIAGWIGSNANVRQSLNQRRRDLGD